jgi:hypothetical protein
MEQQTAASLEARRAVWTAEKTDSYSVHTTVAWTVAWWAAWWAAS